MIGIASSQFVATNTPSKTHLKLLLLEHPPTYSKKEVLAPQMKELVQVAVSLAEFV
jgi:hypothetical protein